MSVLRRFSTNIVDVLTAEGHYLRALRAASGPVIVRVEQTGPRMLTVTINGDAVEHERIRALVGRMLGVDRDLRQFGRAAAALPC